MVCKEDILVMIERSCSSLVDDSTDLITIDETNLRRAVESSGAAQPGPSRAPPRLPLKFDTLEDEVNYFALSHLLNFGSSHDERLLASAGRSSRETVEYGLMACHLDGRSLDAMFIAHFSKQQVNSYFQVDYMIEKEVRPGIRLSKPGPLAVWVNGIISCLNGTGRILLERRQSSLGGWILSLLDEQQRDSPSSEPAAALFIESLVSAIPGFQDEWCQGSSAAHTAEGKEEEKGGPSVVKFERKAQNLAKTLALRFGGEDSRFAFRDLACLSLDSSAKTVAALLGNGIVTVVDPGLKSALSRHKDLGGSREEAVLRSAAVEVGRRARSLAMEMRESEQKDRPWPESCLTSVPGAQRTPSGASGSDLPWMLSAPHSLAY